MKQKKKTTVEKRTTTYKKELNYKKKIKIIVRINVNAIERMLSEEFVYLFYF
jgi:hypothetical protein